MERGEGNTVASRDPGAPPGDAVPVGLTDEAIIGRVLAGERALFELLMRRNNQRLYRVARSIVGAEDAEDVVQEAYVRAYERLGAFDGRARFSTWLTKIAVNEALARLRVKERARALGPDAIEGGWADALAAGVGVDEAVGRGEIARILSRAVDGLPLELRAVFTFRMIEKMSTAETAKCLEISESNVKVRLHRARAMLREQIDRRVGAEAGSLYQFGGEACDRIVEGVLERLGVGEQNTIAKEPCECEEM